ncbi:transcription factor GTE1-like [Syzygium oleosum]|uniref:transcription factor GTE1-like n=1 Tax=Syzygium oleosum TaxID=219896 RepID=UPI0024BB4265|nr:transcription factor GTE1-like [Syzygium oleosum]XP_056163989.1 transcription factor GTE1-like [Syzygium oleosum]
MEEMGLDGLIPYVETGNSGSEIESCEHHVDQILIKVNELEKGVNEVEQFYHDQSKKQPSVSKGSALGQDERQVNGLKKLQQDGCSSREAAAAKRMQQLISQFGIILRQITQHKWAWPFLQPVDVKALGLRDYHKVIEKPMDFGTIKKQMEATDGTAYKNVREICADVRLVFKNAMKYNDEKNQIHVMAKTLLGKFEDKWLPLLPKVTEEEKRLEQEEAEAQLAMQLAMEAANARMARQISNELYEADMHLEELREIVISRCRKISTDEKRKIAAALDELPVEDVDKALEIVAQYDPSFQSKSDLVDLDLDAQSECTLWRLKFFVKGALEVQEKSATVVDANNNHDRSNDNNAYNNNNKKRKKAIRNAIAKTAKKRSLKPSS